MEEKRTIALLDEQGNKREVEHIMTYAHEGKHYIAFEDDAGVYLFRIQEKPGEDDVYLPIENEIELEEAWSVFKDIYDEETEM